MSLRNTSQTLVATLVTLASLSTAGYAQKIPEGTRLRVKLNEPLVSGETAKGRVIEFLVVDGFTTPDGVGIAEGARATGQVIVSESKARMGRGGKLDFTIDRVMAADGAWVPLRYTPYGSQGKGSKGTMIAMMAGLAVVSPVAAPVALLKKGKDIRLERGASYDVYTDMKHELATTAKPAPKAEVATASANPARVAVLSNEPAAEIWINGNFMGNAPLRVNLKPGTYQFKAVAGRQTWERSLTVEAGAELTLHANPTPGTVLSKMVQ